MSLSSSEIQSILDASMLTGQPAILPPGRFVGNWQLKDVRSLRIQGAGKDATVLIGQDPSKPVLDARGLWFSTISDLCLQAGTAVQNAPVLNIDKGDRLGVQGNTFQNLLVNAQGINDGQRGPWAVGMCLEGQHGAQGDTQLFINCHLMGAKLACYYQMGFNALSNQFIGGNCMNYDRCGIELNCGSINVYGMAFQCQHGANQIRNGGWDIACFQGGSGIPMLITGCRTESLRFCKSAWSQPATILCCAQEWAVGPYDPNHSYRKGDCIADKQTLTIWECQQDGDPIELWKLVEHNAVELENGRVMDSAFWGSVRQTINPNTNGIQINKSTKLKPGVDVVFVDATHNNVEVELPPTTDQAPFHSVTVVRGDRSGNLVVVKSFMFNNDPFNHSVLIDSTKSVTFRVLGGGTIDQRYYY